MDRITRTRRLLGAAAAALLAVLLSPLLPAARAQTNKDYVRPVNGAKLHFRVIGRDKSAPYLLILHGGPGFAADTFYPWGMESDIEGWFNVVYLDQRGSGLSEPLKIADIAAPKPEEVKGYTIPALLDDIEAVRQILKVEKWYVLGHSWGGMLGLEYVTAHPEHVAGYIHMAGMVSQPALQESVLDFAKDYYEKRNATVSRDAAAKARALPASPERLAAWYRLAQTDPEFLQAAYFYDAKNAMEYLGKVAKADALYKLPASPVVTLEPTAALVATEHYATRDETPLLAKVSVPTLVLHGADDHVVPLSQAQAVHDAIKGSSLVILHGCGHFPFIDRPGQTKTAIMAFLTTTEN